jgi:hypothetical protein
MKHLKRLLPNSVVNCKTAIPPPNAMGVAIIPVTGPLFRYANIFTAISGASSYELIARDL